MTELFSRKTDKGMLICKMNGTEVEFHLEGSKIRRQSVAEIEPVESLEGKEIHKELYEKLLKVGANAIWNYQIALYNDEMDIINNAIRKAKEEKRQAEKTQLENTDIVVKGTLYNGTPKRAENAKFSWFFGHNDFLTCKKTGRSIFQMAYMRDEGGSDAITDPEMVASIRRFWDDLHLIQKTAEATYEKKQREKDKAEYYRNNPRLAGLSLSEIKAKEKEWDNLHNEGGKGFNPYGL